LFLFFVFIFCFYFLFLFFVFIFCFYFLFLNFLKYFVLISFLYSGPNLNSPFPRFARETRIEAVILFFIIFITIFYDSI